MNEYTIMCIGRPVTTLISGTHVPGGGGGFVSEMEVGMDTLRTGRHNTKVKAEAALMDLLKDHIFNDDKWHWEDEE